MLAVVVALAAILPISAQAMAMPVGMMSMEVHGHCPSCPHELDNGTIRGKMPACQAFACASALATLPSPTLMPARVLLRTIYQVAAPIRRTGAPPALDPFPPRLIPLV